MRIKLERIDGKSVLIGMIVACLILILAIPVTIYLRSEAAYRYRKANFCTTNDEIYQAILNDHESWIAYYRPLIQFTGFGSPHLIITVPSGARYTVNADIWDKEDDIPEFFLVTETTWQEKFGNNGYIYSTERRAFIDSRYHTEAISENIYCYRFKTREEYEASS